MKKAFTSMLVLAIAVFVCGTACTQKEQAKEPAKEVGQRGEALFKQLAFRVIPMAATTSIPRSPFIKRTARRMV